MIDSAYTKKKIISFFVSVVKNYLLVLAYGVMLTALTHFISWNVLFNNIPMQNVSNIEQHIFTTNDVFIITMARIVTCLLLVVSISILYRDNTTSIIKLINLIMFISGIIEFVTIMFGVVKLTISLNIKHSHEFFLIWCSINILTNIYCIYTLLWLYFKLTKIDKRIKDTNLLEINTL
jgi:hypothetical protein